MKDEEKTVADMSIEVYQADMSIEVYQAIIHIREKMSGIAKMFTPQAVAGAMAYIVAEVVRHNGGTRKNHLDLTEAVWISITKDES